MKRNATKFKKSRWKLDTVFAVGCLLAPANTLLPKTYVIAQENNILMSAWQTGLNITSKNNMPIIYKVRDFLVEDIWWRVERGWNWVIHIPSEIKYFIQRGRRGWADCDTWSMDNYMTDVLLGLMKKYEEDTNGYPCSFKTAEEWHVVLKKIITGFEAMKEVCDESYWGGCKNKNGAIDMDIVKIETDKRVAKFNEGIDLFKKYYLNLWW